MTSTPNFPPRFCMNFAHKMKVRKVTSVVLDEAVPVFDATSPKHHNYVLANGCVVHNTARNARNGDYQELLPLRGKILNAMKHDEADVLLSRSVLNILAMLGFDPNAANPYDKLRVGKIISLADPDPDGPLHGDTIVPVCLKATVGDVVQSTWMEVPIKDLALPEWQNRVYYVNAFDGSKFVEAQAHSARVTTWAEKQISLLLSNGKRVVCAPTHQFVLSTTRYDNRIIGQLANGMQLIRADKIKVGDLLSSVGPEVAMESTAGTRLSTLTVVKMKEQRCPPTPWYCLTVPAYANFALSNGLVSKNCHINSLILTLLFKFLPDLFKRGMVYVAKSAEYYAIANKKLYGGATPDELKAKLDKAGVKATIHHIKGYGEVSSAVLETLAFNPQTRNLIKISSPTDLGGEEFRGIMGEGSTARKLLLGI